MKKQWLRAAERYEAASQPGFRARKKRPLPPTAHISLQSFLANGEGEAARKLLAASSQEICLGYSESIMSRTIAVILDGDGLKTHSGLVGMAAVYSKEEPKREVIDATKALDLLRSFPKEGNLLQEHYPSDEETLLANLHRQLNQIAAAAP